MSVPVQLQADGKLKRIDDDIDAPAHITVTDSGKLKLGSGVDLEIYHTGAHAYISNTTGDLLLNNTASGSIYFRINNVESFRVNPDRSVSFTRSVTLADGYGIAINTDDLSFYTSNGHSYIDNTAGDLYIRHTQASNSIHFQVGSTPANALSIGADKAAIFQGSVLLASDSTRLELGAGSDLKIYHDGSHANIQNGTGNLAVNCGPGNAYFYTGASNTLALILNGSNQDAQFQSHVYLNGADKVLALGATSQLSLHHDSTNGYIQNYTGDLIIDNDVASKSIYIRTGATPTTALTISSDQHATFYRHNITTLSYPGVTLENSTAATVGVPKQNSPGLHFKGSAWETTVGSSDIVEHEIYSESANGTTVTGTLIFRQILNEGSPVELLKLANSGVYMTSPASSTNQLGIRWSGADCNIGANGAGMTKMRVGLGSVIGSYGPYIEYDGTSDCITFYGDDSAIAGRFDASQNLTVYGESVSQQASPVLRLKNASSTNVAALWHDTTKTVLESDQTNGGNLTLRAGGADALTIDDSQVATFADHVYIGTSKRLYFSGTTDMSIRHNASDGYIDCTTGTLSLQTGSTTALTLDASQNATFVEGVYIGDDKRLYFGADEDFQIYFDETTNDDVYLDNKTGDTIFRTWPVDSYATAFRIYANKNVQFYGHADLTDSLKIRLGSSQDFNIGYNGTSEYGFVDVDNGYLVIDAGSNIWLRTGGQTNTMYLDGTTQAVTFYGDVMLGTTNTTLTVVGDYTTGSGVADVGLHLTNNTAATSDDPDQWSPALMFTARAYDTDGASSDKWDWEVMVTTTTGNDTASRIDFRSRVNDGSWSTTAYLDKSGLLYLSGDLNMAAGKNIYLDSGFGHERIHHVSDGIIDIYAGSNRTLRIEETIARFDSNVMLGDSDELLLGDSSDFKLYYNGSSCNILSTTSAGDLRLRTQNNSVTIEPGGAVALTVDSTGVSTFSGAAGTDPDGLTSATTIATDCNGSNVFIVTLGHNATLGDPTNKTGKDGFTFIWIVKQPGSGGPYTLAYNAKFKFPGGTAPTLSTGASEVDIITAIYDETADEFYCVPNLDFS